MKLKDLKAKTKWSCVRTTNAYWHGGNLQEQRLNIEEQIKEYIKDRPEKGTPLYLWSNDNMTVYWELEEVDPTVKRFAEIINLKGRHYIYQGKASLVTKERVINGTLTMRSKDYFFTTNNTNEKWYGDKPKAKNMLPEPEQGFSKKAFFYSIKGEEPKTIFSQLKLI